MKLIEFSFLQTIASKFVLLINPHVLHNISKYIAIYKSLYLAAIENIGTCYVEIGVYKGSSFKHAIRTSKKFAKYNNNFNFLKFYGYDSFEGFEKKDKDKSKNIFFKEHNFVSDYDKLLKQTRKLLRNDRFELIKGNFSDVFNRKNNMNEKISVFFIDCDFYDGAFESLNYFSKNFTIGTIIICDDYMANVTELTISDALNKFFKDYKLNLFHLFDYGIGGKVFILK